MDTLRYAAALVVWTAVPPTLLYWYLIHPLTGHWQTVGRTRTLMVVLPLCLLLLGVMLRWSGPVAPTDLGTSYPAFYSGLILFAGAVFADRRIRRDLGARTVAGPTELLPGAHPGPRVGAGTTGEGAVQDREAGQGDGAAGQPGTAGREDAAEPVMILVQEGAYGRVRHPRYAAVTVGTLGLALVAHHAAAYAVVAGMVPLVLALARLEEAHLVRRFGEEYLAYRARVPAFIPRLHGKGR